MAELVAAIFVFCTSSSSGIDTYNTEDLVACNSYVTNCIPNTHNWTQKDVDACGQEGRNKNYVFKVRKEYETNEK